MYFSLWFSYARKCNFPTGESFLNIEIYWVKMLRRIGKWTLSYVSVNVGRRRKNEISEIFIHLLGYNAE
jgi:hypothetical protein